MKTLSLSDINLLDIGNKYQISGTIWSAADHSFVTLFPGKQEDFSNLDILPMDLTDWEKFLRQTDLLETEIFGEDPQTGKIIKAIYRKTQRNIDAFMQWKVFQRDDYACRYCGKTGIPLTVDHIDLWENGGATIPDNLLSACKQCNKDRGRMEYPDWLQSIPYKKVSQYLSVAVQEANEEIIAKLPDLQKLRVKNIRSR